MKKEVKPVQKNLAITGRNLPHWQMGGSIYFITFRTKSAKLPHYARKVVLDACLYFATLPVNDKHRQNVHRQDVHRQDACATARYTLYVAVIMPDHAHLILRPDRKGMNGWWPLSVILHSIKSYTAGKINKILNRSGRLWQDESFDRIIRNEKELLEKWNYIRNNPVKKGLCGRPEDWDTLFECIAQASCLSV